MGARTALAGLVGYARLTEHDGDRVRFRGPDAVLPSSFALTDAAGALVGALGLALDRIAVRRAGSSPRPVDVDLVHASVACQSERHLRLDGEPPRLWDPLAGHYRAADGWVRFHTNFDHHRAAVLNAFGLDETAERPDLERAVGGHSRAEVEDLVVGRGGVATAVRTMAEWHAHPHAIATDAIEPIELVDGSGRGGTLGPAPPDRPLAGVRVLDLTRIIAGPVCTRTLAAYGADVLRVGAPGLPVVEPILADTTLGKRFCHIDLATASGRELVLGLASTADVVVAGFRPGALEARGVGADDLLDANPSLVLAELSAFGGPGPWAGRRGFDSITQSATGIVAEETAATGSSEPVSLPCQMLDHGSGFLLALGIMTALAARHDGDPIPQTRVSLLATRNWLVGLGRRDDLEIVPPADDEVDRLSDRRRSPWGAIRHVRHPDPVEGMAPRWEVGPSQPGRDRPVWLPRT